MQFVFEMSALQYKKFLKKIYRRIVETHHVRDRTMSSNVPESVRQRAVTEMLADSVVAQQVQEALKAYLQRVLIQEMEQLSEDHIGEDRFAYDDVEPYDFVEESFNEKAPFIGLLTSIYEQSVQRQVSASRR